MVNRKNTWSFEKTYGQLKKQSMVILINSCNNQSRPSSVQQGFKEIKSKRRVSLNDSIEDERHLLKKPSPNRSYSEGYLNDNNDTDIDQDFDCSNSDLSTHRNIFMEPDQRGAARSSSFERQSPIHQLEDQIQFYERVKDTFLANLDKPACLSPQSSSPKRRRSTSSEQKFLQCDKLVYKVCDNGDHATLSELTMQMPREHRLVQSVSVPAIVVHETRKENEKSIENYGCHGNRDQNIDKSTEKASFRAEQIFNQQHSTQSLKQQCDKFTRTKLCSFLSSASKQRHKMDDQPHLATCSTDSRVLLHCDDEPDEFFVAISSQSLRTGSCPEFYWHRSAKCSPKRARSQTDLVALKSYENITQSNYVQMINSMIHGAVSDMADPDYADYLKRHVQGLFDNLAPVLMKSKSNEEIAMASPSRLKISPSQTMPKSLSFDFELLADHAADDAMDFSKFGLGIRDHASSDDSLRSDELERSFLHSHSDDDSETRRLIPTDSDDDDDEDEDGEKRAQSAELSDSLEDDVIIECKIDYRVKSGSDSDSSSTDSDEMEGRSCSAYDNMKERAGMSGEEPESAMLSTSVHSVNSLVNETLASLASLNSEEKSGDEEDGPEFILADDFADLDENWLQEDDWFGCGTMRPAESMHSVRQLEPIAEEEEEIVLKKSHDLKDLFDSVENFKISFEYKYRPESEKLRSQECNISSLLGSTAPTVQKQRSSVHSGHQKGLTLTQQNEQQSSCVDMKIGEEVRETHNGESVSGCVEQVQKNCFIQIGKVDHTLTEKIDDDEHQVEVNKDLESEHGQGKDNDRVPNENNGESLAECFEEIQKNCFLQVEIDHREQNDESLTSQESSETLTEKVDPEENLEEVQEDLESKNNQGSDNNSVQNDKNGESLTECFEEIQKNCFLQVEIDHREQNDELFKIQESCETLTEKVDPEENLEEVQEDLQSKNNQGSDIKSVQNDKNGENLTECFEEIQKNCFLQVEIDHRDQNDELFKIQESCETLTEKIDDDEHQVEVHRDLESEYGKEKGNDRAQNENNGESLTECFEEIQKNCFLQVEIDHREQNDESLESGKNIDHIHSDHSLESIAHQKVEVKHQNDESLTSQGSCETLTEKFDDEKYQVEVHRELESKNNQRSGNKSAQNDKNGESLTECFEEIQKNCFLQVEIDHIDQNDELFTIQESCGTFTEINDFKIYSIESENGHESDNKKVQNDENGENLTECFEEIQKNCFLQVKIEHKGQNDESLTSQESCETLTEKVDPEENLEEVHRDLEGEYGQGSDNNSVQNDKNGESLTECFEEIQKNCFLQVEIDHREQNDESLESGKNIDHIHSDHSLESIAQQKVEVKHQNDESLTSQGSCETLTEKFDDEKYQVEVHRELESEHGQGKDNDRAPNENNGERLTECFEEIQKNCFLQVEIDHREQHDESLTSQKSCETFADKNDQTSGNNRAPSPAGCFEETKIEIKDQEEHDESLTSQTESSETLAEDSIVHLQINQDKISDNNTFNLTQETNESIGNQSLTSWYEHIETNRCLLQVQIKHKDQHDESLTSQESCDQELEIKCQKNESVDSDTILNETLTEDQAETSLHGKHGAASKSCSSIETTSEKCEETQKDSVLETRYCEWCESDSGSDALPSQKRADMQKDSLLDTQYTANGDDTSSSECQSADNVTDEEEIHVEYFEYVISNDLYEQVHAAECPIERKCDSELDLSKLELN
ncbi:hypothetical protein BpHYR1_013298, partial [Brachionus plicatilis]